jgi:hypothetical protein
MPTQSGKKPSEQEDPHSNNPKHDNPPPEHKGGHESQKDPRGKPANSARKQDQGQPKKQ